MHNTVQRDRCPKTSFRHLENSFHEILYSLTKLSKLKEVILVHKFYLIYHCIPSTLIGAWHITSAKKKKKKKCISQVTD